MRADLSDPVLPTAGRIDLAAHRLPADLVALAARAFDSPGITADALLLLSDLAADAAKVAPVPYWSGAYSRLADLLAFAAPMHANEPLPGPGAWAPLTKTVLLTAARVLETEGPPEVLALAGILRAMADAQIRRTA